MQPMGDHPNEIASFEDLLRITAEQRAHDSPGVDRWLYRGQLDGSKPLTASAGRLPRPRSSPETVDRDLKMFATWRRRAPFYDALLPSNDWEALAVAAHHGLATRLLDWSLNPLVALFFAVRDDGVVRDDGALHDDGLDASDTDGVLWAFQVGSVIDPERQRLGEVDEVAVFFPAGRTHRVIRQRGAFTYHPDPFRPLEELAGAQRLARHPVPAGAKRALRGDLDRMGINYEMLFPDLEGFARHLNWLAQAQRG